MESLAVLRGFKVSFAVKGQIVPGTLSSHLIIIFSIFNFQDALRQITFIVTKMVNMMGDRFRYVSRRGESI